MENDLDEMAAAARIAEEKTHLAMVDAARLADELRAEQQSAMLFEKEKKLLEAQVKYSSQRADDAKQNALKGGRKTIIKLETKMWDLG